MPVFNKEIQLLRKQKKALQRKQFANVRMSFEGKTPVIEDMGQFMANAEEMKEDLVKIFYTELPDLDTLDDEAFEELYKPIEELDPLNSKKFRSGSR